MQKVTTQDHCNKSAISDQNLAPYEAHTVTQTSTRHEHTDIVNVKRLLAVISSPSGFGQSPDTKRIWALENASSDNIFGSSYVTVLHAGLV